MPKEVKRACLHGRQIDYKAEASKSYFDAAFQSDLSPSKENTKTRREAHKALIRANNALAQSNV